MRKSIREYVRSCVTYNALMPAHPVAPRGVIPTPPSPFLTWGMDFIGPFPYDQRGCQYLLTCIDHLTSWAEAIPLPSKNSATVWDAFSTHIVAHYGLPAVLITDNGGKFTEKAFENWTRDNGIDHRLTTPYHPQTNGMTERFNGTLQKLLL